MAHFASVWIIVLATIATVHAGEQSISGIVNSIAVHPLPWHDDRNGTIGTSRDEVVDFFMVDIAVGS
ncbi:MAG: hypothetical protein J0I17_01860 ['Candidatus Kapabacteria' thiocyanatum]|uniref:Uncharacterized protein n=1 Tax=Candidatus Kapaibacterium thiocyanatum TaxID=1895771 RepID=A0A1M3KX17_9BACT|nr:hypothetical protein ['Candidatus Kapabacteria' thiocyanatum]OJX56923.1 MAG: hypothetical protein BGO89_10390 ['Candidatus Kapabacteria' thiocyanatum]